MKFVFFLLLLQFFCPMIFVSPLFFFSLFPFLQVRFFTFLRFIYVFHVHFSIFCQRKGVLFRFFKVFHYFLLLSDSLYRLFASQRTSQGQGLQRLLLAGSLGKLSNQSNKTAVEALNAYQVLKMMTLAKGTTNFKQVVTGSL